VQGRKTPIDPKGSEGIRKNRRRRKKEIRKERTKTNE
jgi:hypothetical protein